ILTENEPGYAIRTTSGGVWTTSAGLGWADPYDKRVWDYNVSLGEAAAKAGFDEIQFDYVRFPTDGDLSAAVFPRKTNQTKTDVITSFAKYAGQRLRPLGVALRDFDTQLTGEKTRIVPWLQDFSLGRTYTLADVQDQIEAARDSGAEGFLLWNAAGLYTRGALAPR